MLRTDIPSEVRTYTVGDCGDCRLQTYGETFCGYPKSYNLNLSIARMRFDLLTEKPD